MVDYKSYSIIDGEPRWIIEDENRNINKSSTREQLKECIVDDRRDKKFFGIENIKNWLKGE